MASTAKVIQHGDPKVSLPAALRRTEDAFIADTGKMSGDSREGSVSVRHEVAGVSKTGTICSGSRGHR